MGGSPWLRLLERTVRDDRLDVGFGRRAQPVKVGSGATAAAGPAIGPVGPVGPVGPALGPIVWPMTASLKGNSVVHTMAAPTATAVPKNSRRVSPPRRVA